MKLFKLTVEVQQLNAKYISICVQFWWTFSNKEVSKPTFQISKQECPIEINQINVQLKTWYQMKMRNAQKTEWFPFCKSQNYYFINVTGKLIFNWMSSNFVRSAEILYQRGDRSMRNEIPFALSAFVFAVEAITFNVWRRSKVELLPLEANIVVIHIY